MSISKAWNWGRAADGIWLEPSEESYHLAARWKRQGFAALLDFGCGLGRHSIFFARQGFKVSAFDLSCEGVGHLAAWARREKLEIDTKVADMLSLPYPDNTFDCLFAYHVISHTDGDGIREIMRGIKRVVRPRGEIYLTLCSKETWSFSEAGYPKIDENTVVKTEDGPEEGIPHFYVGRDDIVELFAAAGMQLLRIRHIDDCYWDGQMRNSKHYFVLAANAVPQPQQGMAPKAQPRPRRPFTRPPVRAMPK